MKYADIRDEIKTWIQVVAHIATVVVLYIAVRQFGISSESLGIASKQFEISARQADTAAKQADNSAKQAAIAANQLDIAAKQFALNATAQRHLHTAAVLAEGRELQDRYQDGKAEARDIMAFYYKVYSMDKDELLVKEQAVPLIHSLEEQIIEDPRVRKYWSGENKKRYSEDFTEHLKKLYEKEK